MKLYTKILTIALMIPSLSGCILTEALWDNDFSGDRSRYENIHSFGFTKADSKNLPPNRLVMLAENAVYVTEVTPEHKLAKALRETSLSKRYGTGIELKLDNETDGNFVAFSRGDKELCLSYVLFNDSPANWKKNDIPKLQALGFKKEKYSDNPNVTDYYRQCYGEIRGVRYAMKGDLPAEYRFKYPEQIYLNIQQPSKADSTMKTTGAIMLTPFAIMGDIILLPILGPFLWHN